MSRPMTRLASILAALLLLCGSSSLAQSDRNAIARLHALVLPEFKLERATLREGLDAVRLAWTAKYPEESFPVITLESLEVGSDSHLRATMNLKNVPALSAVTYLAQTHAMTVRFGLDVVVLRPVLAADEGAWESVMLRTSPRVISALELSIEADGDNAANRALKKRLESYGIRFEPGFDVRWFGGSKQLFIRNTPEEVSKAKGLFMLFDAGYTLRKGTE